MNCNLIKIYKISAYKTQVFEKRLDKLASERDVKNELLRKNIIGKNLKIEIDKKNKTYEKRMLEIHKKSFPYVIKTIMPALILVIFLAFLVSFTL